MIKLTSKERDILDLLQDCEWHTLILSKDYKGVIEQLTEKGYIVRMWNKCKLNVEGK